MIHHTSTHLLKPITTMHMMGHAAEQVEMDYPETLDSLFVAQLLDIFLITW